MTTGIAQRKSILWIFIAIVCIAIIGTSVFLLIHYHSTHSRIQWNMQGTWMNFEGTDIGNMELSISGKIEKDTEARDVLRLNFRLPEDFRFIIPDNEPSVFYSGTDNIDIIPYYVGSAFCLDRETGEIADVYLALSEEKEYAMLYWPEDPEKYLVASTKQGVSPDEIVSYFQVFIQSVAPRPK